MAGLSTRFLTLKPDQQLPFVFNQTNDDASADDEGLSRIATPDRGSPWKPLMPQGHLLDHGS
jgi:hypothetical protein